MRIEPWCTTEELSSLIGKTKDATRRQRLRVIRWALDGLTADDVATQTKLCRRQVQSWVQRLNVHAMGLNPSPSGETLRFFVLLEFGDGEVPNEFAQSI